MPFQSACVNDRRFCSDLIAILKCCAAARADLMQCELTPVTWKPGCSQVRGWGGGGGVRGRAFVPFVTSLYFMMFLATKPKGKRINFVTRKQGTLHHKIEKKGLPGDCYFLLKFQLSSTVRWKPFQHRTKGQKGERNEAREGLKRK